MPRHAANDAPKTYDLHAICFHSLVSGHSIAFVGCGSARYPLCRAQISSRCRVSVVQFGNRERVGSNNLRSLRLLGLTFTSISPGSHMARSLFNEEDKSRGVVIYRRATDVGGRNVVGLRTVPQCLAASTTSENTTCGFLNRHRSRVFSHRCQGSQGLRSFHLPHGAQRNNVATANEA